MFVEGQWQREKPTIPGNFFVANRAGTPVGIIKLRRNKKTKELETIDCLSWGGWWWSEPVPPLPKPPEWIQK